MSSSHAIDPDAPKGEASAAGRKSDLLDAAAVRECNDRIARMELELQELRERFARAQDRHARVLSHHQG